MNKLLYRAGFFLALIILSLSTSLPVFAAGEDLSPTPTPDEVSDDSKGGTSVYGNTQVYGSAPVYGGEPVYGGGVITPREGEIVVDKMVKNPSTGIYVDNLGPTDPKYRPLDIVYFQIKVSNPTNVDLPKVDVVDTLPDYVDYMSGAESYDQDNRQLRFSINDLKAEETQIVEIKARVSHQSSIPEDKSVVCPVNVVEAELGDKTDRDESQFCIEKEVEVPEVPAAGAEMIILPLLAGALTTGLYLRKRLVKI